MRYLIFALVLMAGTKIGVQEYIRRDAVYDTIMNAYREHAVAACRQTARAQPQLAQTLPAAAWQAPVDTELTIGNPNLSVSLWQTSHQSWQDKYRTPYVHVHFAAHSKHLRCIYDIRRGNARFSDDAEAKTMETRRPDHKRTVDNAA